MLIYVIELRDTTSDYKGDHKVELRPDAFYKLSDAMEWAEKAAHAWVEQRRGDGARPERQGKEFVVDKGRAHTTWSVGLVTHAWAGFRQTRTLVTFAVVGINLHGSVIDAMADLVERETTVWQRIKAVFTG